MNTEMGLAHITLTGIDRNTDLSKVWMLSKKYPLVEWGVLYSMSQDRGNEYPTRSFILELVEFAARFNISLSLHLCSQAVHELLNGNSLVNELAHCFPRIQLNNIHEQSNPVDLGILSTFIENRKRSVITQHNAGSRYVSMGVQSKYHQVLCDDSSGQGIQIADFTYIAHKAACGWAGGLNSTNLLTLLPKMYLASQGRGFWFDLQSALRTNGWFDLFKCEEILKIAYEVSISRSAA